MQHILILYPPLQLTIKPVQKNTQSYHNYNTTEKHFQENLQYELFLLIPDLKADTLTQNNLLTDVNNHPHYTNDSILDVNETDRWTSNRPS